MEENLMLKSGSRTLRQTYAMVEKGILLRLRYPMRFFSTIFINSLISLIPLIFIFSGLLEYGSEDFFTLFYFANAPPSLIKVYFLYQFIEENFFNTFNPGNYLSWLLIGNIIFTFCLSGFEVFQMTFSMEKYWNTIQGILLAPVNKFIVLFGVLIQTLIESSIYFLVFIVFCYIVFPTSIIQIILVFLIAFIMLIASGGIGLIIGVIFISTESFSAIFRLIQFIILFFSCYSIPLILLPELFQQISLLNPFYHGTNLARNVYYGIFGSSELISLIYIISFAFIISIISVYLFNKIWKKYGIHGY